MNFVRDSLGHDLVRDWLRRVEVKTLFIEPGSSWENGYIKSFNGKLIDELLNGEIFDTLPDNFSDHLMQFIPSTVTRIF